MGEHIDSKDMKFGKPILKYMVIKNKGIKEDELLELLLKVLDELVLFGDLGAVVALVYWRLGVGANGARSHAAAAAAFLALRTAHHPGLHWDTLLNEPTLIIDDSNYLRIRFFLLNGKWFFVRLFLGSCTSTCT